MNIAGIKSHFANWRAWELNPIVIKELRQSVRSWTVNGMMLLFLATLLMTSLVFLIFQTFDSSANMELGADMFAWFFGVLAFSSIFFIPLYLGVRVAAERVENNMDLLYVSTLSPARIIFGKFLCGAYMTVLFFSMCMPFMAFTNLLRGVDLPTVFLILGYLFMVVCGANMVAIFLACLPLSRPFKFLFILYQIFQSFSIMGFLVSMSFEMMRSGVGSLVVGRAFWGEVTTYVGITLVAIGLFFVLAVALISPQSANRAFPVRLYITIIWIVTGLISAVWAWKTGDGGLMYPWIYLAFVLMAISLLVVISNHDQLSLRVQRRIPRNLIGRALAFPFFNGAAGGLLWIGIILLGTYLVSLGVNTYFPVSAGASPGEGHWFGTTTLYIFDYALTALFIHRAFLPHRVPKITGLLAVLLAGAWALIPGIVLFFLNRLSWNSVEGLQLGNVFNVFVVREDADLVWHRYFASGWLILILLLNSRWFVRQLAKFHPPAPVPPVLS